MDTQIMYYILFFLVVLKCKNKMTETHECKSIKINLREELFAKDSAYQPFQAETPSLRRPNRCCGPRDVTGGEAKLPGRASTNTRKSPATRRFSFPPGWGLFEGKDSL